MQIREQVRRWGESEVATDVLGFHSSAQNASTANHQQPGMSFSGVRPESHISSSSSDAPFQFSGIVSNQKAYVTGSSASSLSEDINNHDSTCSIRAPGQSQSKQRHLESLFPLQTSSQQADAQEHNMGPSIQNASQGFHYPPIVNSAAMPNPQQQQQQQYNNVMLNGTRSGSSEALMALVLNAIWTNPGYFNPS